MVTGANGEGKTNLLEAIGYLATLRSLRGSPAEAMVRAGAAAGRAVVRAEGRREGRRLLIEAELRAAAGTGSRSTASRCADPAIFSGPCRSPCSAPTTWCWSRVVRRAGGSTSTTAGGPAPPPRRRPSPRWTGCSSSATPSSSRRAARPARARTRRQDVVSTLDVWDAKLAAAGEQLADARAALATGSGAAGCGRPTAVWPRRLAPRAVTRVAFGYRRSWEGDLLGALARARSDDLRGG